jgi:hypothetical protein
VGQLRKRLKLLEVNRRNVKSKQQTILKAFSHFVARREARKVAF